MRQRLPEWLKRPVPDIKTGGNVSRILKNTALNTVCNSARCPNRCECFSNNTATFMILGDVCTRNCGFCSVTSGKPLDVDTNEPDLVAQAIKELKLTYAVITSVTRDDLVDYGSGHFAATINAIRKTNKGIKIEVLVPDFCGDKVAIQTVINAKPDVFNHNIETVKNLYSKVRPEADYQRSLNVLKYVKETNPKILTKSGIMTGLGESIDELLETIFDLKENLCDIITVGQYIQPTKNHLQTERFLNPEEFVKIKIEAKKIGIKHVFSGPLVRSSYRANEVFTGNL
jgi:lipoyl synthase